MSHELPASDPTDDAVLGGRLRLLQPRTGHRVGHDAILLAAATAAHAGEHAIDLGAGVGAAGLALAVRVAGVSVTLIEIDRDLAALATENADRNNLGQRARAVALDIAAPAPAFTAAGILPQSADHVLMNPPFRDPTRQQVSPDPRRRRAHATPREMLGVWVDAAGRILRPGGSLTLIFQADGIADVLQACEPGFGAVAIMPIYPKPGLPAIRILVRALKASRAPTRLQAGLLLNGDDGRPTAAAEAVLRGAAALSFDSVA
jgi:tRNA1(Val) A37 N6-methylase TrmN6